MMLESLVELMLAAARAASKEIMDVYSRSADFAAKVDGSPLTEADVRADAVIRSVLASTSIPILSEVGANDLSSAELQSTFFCVDPLDGTKEFLSRNGEFTVNIALVEHGRPTQGVIVRPTTGVSFVGGGAGAFEIAKDDSVRSLRTRPATATEVVASRSHGQDSTGIFCERMGLSHRISIGSSLKFCLVSRGDAVLYPRLAPTCEWDTAAGQAVLEAAGGVVLAMDGEPLRYGRGAPFINPSFIAAADEDWARRGLAQVQRNLVD